MSILCNSSFEISYNLSVEDFREWIGRKYTAWSNNGQKSESQYAQWLDISQPTVNAWLRRTRGAPKTREIIEKLANKYGREIYDVLGFETQNQPAQGESEDQRELEYLYENLPEEQQKILLSYAKFLASQGGNERIQKHFNKPNTGTT